MLGAVGGATVNMIFMNHFQRVARGHFAIRRLERQYGAERRAPALRCPRAAPRAEEQEADCCPMAAGLDRRFRRANAGAGAAADGARSIRGSPGCGACGAIATLLLVLMAAVFIATSVVKLDWPWLPYLRAFAEAGMVGACADWFAVVALFRRPFGLPIPHTGIIPNNKERIGAALGRFITNNFLTAAAMNERLARLDVIGTLAQWMEEPANAKRLGDYVALALPRISQVAAGAADRRNARQAGAAGARGDPGGAAGVEDAGDHLGARRGAGAARAAPSTMARTGSPATRTFSRAKMTEQSSRWIPKWVDKMIAEKVHQRHV